MQQLSFTGHAVERVGKRVSLSIGEIQKLINAGLYINVGFEQGRDRAHLVFWSEHDKQCFVAVIDDKTKEMITVLPMDYHATCAWPVSLETQKDAERLYRNRDDTKQLSSGLKAGPDLKETKRLTLSVAVRDPEERKHPPMRNIGRLRMNPVDISRTDIALITEKIKGRGIDVEDVLWITARTKEGESFILYEGEGVDASWWGTR